MGYQNCTWSCWSHAWKYCFCKTMSPYGANEAPYLHPCLSSLGSQLSNVLDEIEQKVNEENDGWKPHWNSISAKSEILLEQHPIETERLHSHLPEINLAVRVLHCSNAMMVLNTIRQNQLHAKFKKRWIHWSTGTKKDEAILKVLRQYIVEFEEYPFWRKWLQDEWVKEAKKRGLSNLTTSPPALDAYKSKAHWNCSKKLGIFSHREVEARHEIFYWKLISRKSRLNHVWWEIWQSTILYTCNDSLSDSSYKKCGRSQIYRHENRQHVDADGYDQKISNILNDDQIKRWQYDWGEKRKPTKVKTYPLKRLLLWWSAFLFWCHSLPCR